MNHEEEIKEILINNAISLIAEGGFEKATTKELTHYGGELPNIKMNEAYIYRIFGSKDKLYEAAFLKLEIELYYALQKCVKEELEKSGSLIEKWYQVFERSWSFIMRNEARCRCYVRYYYSIYFKGNSLATHNEHFEMVIADFSWQFREEADVRAIMHSVFTALLDFAIRVYNGELEDSVVNRPHIFNVLYCMMMTYFKDEIREEIKKTKIF